MEKNPHNCDLCEDYGVIMDGNGCEVKCPECLESRQRQAVNAEISPCPCGEGCNVTQRSKDKFLFTGETVRVLWLESLCGWRGPECVEPEACLAAWNTRAANAMLDKALDALEEGMFETKRVSELRGCYAWDKKAAVLVQSGRYRWANEAKTAIERV